MNVCATHRVSLLSRLTSCTNSTHAHTQLHMHACARTYTHNDAIKESNAANGDDAPHTHTRAGSSRAGQAAQCADRNALVVNSQPESRATQSTTKPNEAVVRCEKHRRAELLFRVARARTPTLDRASVRKKKKNEQRTKPEQTLPRLYGQFYQDHAQPHRLQSSPAPICAWRKKRNDSQSEQWLVIQDNYFTLPVLNSLST
jgi:hypothetical protein